jgi:hypothetical protein
MIATGNGKRRRYRVSYSGVVLKVFKELRYEAFLSGRLEQFDHAWGVIMERLRSDPLGFGEFIQPYPHLQLQARVGSVYPITVQFGVHEQLPMVIIAKIVLATPP